MVKVEIMYDVNGTVSNDVVVATEVNTATATDGANVKTPNQAALYRKAYRILITLDSGEEPHNFRRTNTQARES